MIIILLKLIFILQANFVKSVLILKCLYIHMHCLVLGRLCGLTGIADGHRSIAPGFKPRPGYISRVFHLSLHSIIFRGLSSRLIYFLYKSGRKIATFTLICLITELRCPFLEENIMAYYFNNYQFVFELSLLSQR